MMNRDRKTRAISSRAFERIVVHKHTENPVPG